MTRHIALILSMICWLAGYSSPAGDSITVSFVNIYPGDRIYELEGHSALRLTTPEGDWAVNFGVFDFDRPGFVYRFVKGETDYRVVLMPWQYFQYSYPPQRRIVEHVLDMDSTQTQRLLELLDIQLQPQNATYRYNYVKDNCVTRPLRIVELALGDSIIFTQSQRSEGSTTFRSMMRDFHRNYPWYQFGIDLALGSGIDYPIDRRAMTFAPATLDSMLVSATAGGRTIVRDTRIINDAAPDAMVEPATPWYLTPDAVFWALFVILAAITFGDLRRRHVTRWVDAVFYGMLGLCGILVTFLIFVSSHEATSPNYLLPWLNPLCLIPTIFILKKNCAKIILYWQIVNFVLLFTLCAAWAFIPQAANSAFLPLIISDAMRSASYIYLTIKR